MIFTKTNLGRMLAFDPKSSLSRSEKALLRLIDGKTRLTTLSSTMDPADCSIELIEALLDKELIQLAKTGPGLVGGSVKDENAQPGRARHLALVLPHYDRTMPASLAALLEPERMSDFSDTAAHSFEYQERLDTAKDSLATFVLTYLPDDSALMLQEINQIAHNDQLKATIVTVLSMANQNSQTDRGHTLALNQTLLQLSDQ